MACIAEIWVSKCCVVSSVGSGAVQVVRCVDLLVVWSAGLSAVVSHHRATGAGIRRYPATRCPLLGPPSLSDVNPLGLSCRMRPAFPRRRFLSCRLVPTLSLRSLSPESSVRSAVLAPSYPGLFSRRLVVRPRLLQRTAVVVRDSRLSKSRFTNILFGLNSGLLPVWHDRSYVSPRIHRCTRRPCRPSPPRPASGVIVDLGKY